MAKKDTINVQGTKIILLSHQKEDYISLTDMAKYKNSEIPATVISHWLSTNFSINYMGLWERMNNPDFNLTGFREVKMLSTETGFALSPNIVTTEQISHTYAEEADLLNVALFGKTAKEWRDENPNDKGNMRDYATLEQLVVLSNMESINALLIRQELPQHERLIQLNNVAITQMRSLVESKKMKLLK